MLEKNTFFLNVRKKKTANFFLGKKTANFFLHVEKKVGSWQFFFPNCKKKLAVETGNEANQWCNH